MYEFETNKISKTDLLKLDEKDIIFITNPGRMGDEDGTTFIIKKGKELIAYRVSGWMYGSKDEKEPISLVDVMNQFPKWKEAWQNGLENDYKGKYKYFYMGFGNGLSVDNSIYEEYKKFLDEAVRRYLKKYSDEERKKMKNAAVFNVWDNAVVNMANDKGYVLK